MARRPISIMSNKEEENWHVLVDCVHRGENKIIFMSELRATNILSGSIDQHNWVEYGLKEKNLHEVRVAHCAATS